MLLGRIEASTYASAHRSLAIPSSGSEAWAYLVTRIFSNAASPSTPPVRLFLNDAFPAVSCCACSTAATLSTLQARRRDAGGRRRAKPARQHRHGLEHRPDAAGPRPLGTAPGRCRPARAHRGGCSRVGVWRGGGRFGLSVAAPFVWRCPSNPAVAPFPHPSHRTERAQLAHSALGQDIRPSPTESCARAAGAMPARALRESTLWGNGLCPYCPPCVSRTATDVADTRCTGQAPYRHQ
jgi:hypothetical protein